MAGKPKRDPAVRAPCILRGSSRTGLFSGGKKVSEQEFRQPHHNHLTSINAEIDRRDDGNVLVARELLDALRAKIR
jgi:hypothetical protein